MPEIAIIGGGIGGLTTAIALRRYGFEVEVFEQAPVLLDVGAAIALWPNAMRTFQHLGIAEQILDAGGIINEIRWATDSGEFLNQVPINNPQTPAVALHRADLQRILLQALPPAVVSLDHSFLEQDQPDESTTVVFQNGRSISCRFLIGADGIHSDVRNEVVGDDGPIFRGYIVWRGISNSAPNQIPYDVAIEFYGPGKRFGVGPVGHGRVGWWAASNISNEAGATDPREGHQELMELFADWYEPVSHLIESTPATAILRTQTHDRPASRTWGRGRTSLLGDAVHPTTPNLGQGGCMAIEDALVLARCFKKYGLVEAALRAYERARFERTAVIAYASRLYGEVGQWENHLAISMRKKLFSAVPAALLRQAMKIVLDYDAGCVRI